MSELFYEIWPFIVQGIILLMTLLASGHAILNKRDTHSAVAWVGVIWLVPVLGAVLYVILGINRIRRRARALRGSRTRYISSPNTTYHFHKNNEDALEDQFAVLSGLVDEIVLMPLLQGNWIVPLVNGDEAFPAMIKAIDEAERSVALSTYIFDNDRAGRLFLAALDRAVARNVEVRVLIDDMGARYSLPSVTSKLKRTGITVTRFLPTLLPWRMPFVNLRNHRKILVTDGRVGFTGGMNIREGLLLKEQPRNPLQDLHFLMEGPVVDHLRMAFAEDWAFCTGELLRDERWFPVLEPKGTVMARGIPDGPDEDFEKVLWTVHGALACAKSSVRIVTPYFLPDSSLIRSLNLAAMRGVTVDIILPSVNNLPIVKWASTELYGRILEYGCHIWLTPPPFDHTKLMIMDAAWTLFGSANMDPRSFWLDFEFNVECYDRNLAARMEAFIQTKLKGARQVTLNDVNSRRLPVKLRDGFARLFSPYL